MNWLLEPNRCPGLFYGTPAEDGALLRIRTPGGLLNDPQGRAIATLAEQLGSETIQVTNRANLQLRSVHHAPTPRAFQMLQALGLAAKHPSIDHLRNVMASPTAGIDAQELIDTRPLVQALDAYIQRHLEFADLSAKFSIGIDGGGTVGIGTRSAIAWEHRYNEIHLAVENQKSSPTPYFRLFLGADKHLCDTQVLIPLDECITVVAALAMVLLAYGQASQNRPRMKHLLRDWGMERYLEQVNQRLPQRLCPVADSPPPLPTQRYAHLGVHPQRQFGLSYVGVHLELGQLTVTQLRALVQLSTAVGSGQLRLTPWQTMLLPNIPNAQVPEVLHHLSALGLPVSDHQTDAAIVACGGKPGCAVAATDTQSHAIALADYLNQRLTLTSPVNIHFTGCPKSCAQPSPAEITLLGTTTDVSGYPVEMYRIYVTGNLPISDVLEQAEAAQLLGEVTPSELPLRIEQLLTLYQQHTMPGESFGEFADRLSVTTLKRLMSVTA